MVSSYKSRLDAITEDLKYKDDLANRHLTDLLFAQNCMKMVYKAIHMQSSTLSKMPLLGDAAEAAQVILIDPHQLNVSNFSQMTEHVLQYLAITTQILQTSNTKLSQIESSLNQTEFVIATERPRLSLEIPSPLMRALAMAEKAIKEADTSATDEMMARATESLETCNSVINPVNDTAMDTPKVRTDSFDVMDKRPVSLNESESDSESSESEKTMKELPVKKEQVVQGTQKTKVSNPISPKTVINKTVKKTNSPSALPKKK